MKSLQEEQLAALLAILQDGREWFAMHPSAKKTERDLSPEECLRCGYPAGRLLTGTRLSDGGIVWIISGP